MDIDMEFWLVLATIITGLIWLIYVLIQRAKDKSQTTEPWYVEYARSFFPVLLIVLLLRSFLVEPFRIPSSSMLPTLEVGDFILVNKFSYGIRLPVLHTKIIPLGEPKQGDIVVFRYPNDPSTDYIKRVIGVPGDRVRWDNKDLYVNGKAVKHIPVGEYNARDQNNLLRPTLRLTENLEHLNHDILIVPRSAGRVGEITVPEGHYFVMGDNRDRSNDSRAWGLVPEGNLVGRAMLVWFHFNWNGDGFNFSRIGSIH
ncbi:MAG: signal peptidase I [Proteobacteria bacterium]|nr:MAG: signal peptidase I [Pseudomonadota bacterium]